MSSYGNYFYRVAGTSRDDTRHDGTERDETRRDERRDETKRDARISSREIAPFTLRSERRSVMFACADDDDDGDGVPQPRSAFIVGTARRASGGTGD